MAKYLVTKHMVYIETFEIEADNEEEAKDKVWEGDGKAVKKSFEWTHDLDSSNWEVEEKLEKKS